jgi:predicted amidohydrolase
MNCHLGEKSTNLKIARGLVEEAINQKARLIVLPELFSTGYLVEPQDLVLAESIPGPTTNILMAISRKAKVYIAGSIIEKGEARGTVYDTAFLIGPEGLIGTYRKIHLWQNENIRFARGNEYPIFSTPIGKIGMQICYEIGFPEGARILTLKGADIILFPSAFGAPRLYAWDIASCARALENGSYIIASNRWGNEEKIEFAGHSRIIAPNGDILAEALGKNEVLIAKVDLQEIAKQRNQIPYLRDLDRFHIAYEFNESLCLRKGCEKRQKVEKWGT